MRITDIEIPQIEMKFSKNLLSTPTSGFKAEYLRQIGDFLHRKIHSTGLKKHPTRRILLMIKHKEFMEIYERAKIEEGNNKTKTCRKTQWLGYRPRLANKNDQRVFERLNDRAETSRIDRRSR